MKKSITIISTLVFITLTAGTVFAWGPGMGKGGGMQQDCQWASGGQNAGSSLTQEQQDALSALRQKFIDDTYELRTAKLQKHAEMKLLLETSAPDKDKLSALSQEILDLQKQLRDKRIDFVLDAKKISPELGMGMGMGACGGMGSCMNAGKGYHGKGGCGKANWKCPRSQAAE